MERASCRPWALPAHPPCRHAPHRLAAGGAGGGEAKLGAWAEGLLSGTPPSPDTAEGLAIDGKTLRGSQKQGAPGAHRLSALAPRLGVTLAQQAGADKTNEIPVMLDL